MGIVTLKYKYELKSMKKHVSKELAIKWRSECTETYVSHKIEVQHPKDGAFQFILVPISRRLGQFHPLDFENNPLFEVELLL